MDRIKIVGMKPCAILDYCPYGALIEESAFDAHTLNLPEMSCKTYGHDCPVYKYITMDERENRELEIW